MSIKRIIRVAEPRDIDAMQNLLHQLYAEENYEAHPNGKSLAAALFEKTPVRLHALVAEQHGELSGALLYYWGYDISSATYGVHLADMIVQKNVRRQGLGRALFSALCKNCVDEKAAWISLTALRTNAPALAFYHALGFGTVDVAFCTIGGSKIATHAALAM